MGLRIEESLLEVSEVKPEPRYALVARPIGGRP